MKGPGMDVASFLGWNTQKGSIKFNKPNPVNVDVLMCGYHKGAGWLVGDPWKEWFLGCFWGFPALQWNWEHSEQCLWRCSISSSDNPLLWDVSYFSSGHTHGQLQDYNLCLSGARWRHRRCLPQLIHVTVQINHNHWEGTTVAYPELEGTHRDHPVQHPHLIKP